MHYTAWPRISSLWAVSLNCAESALIWRIGGAFTGTFDWSVCQLAYQLFPIRRALGQPHDRVMSYLVPGVKCSRTKYLPHPCAATRMLCKHAIWSRYAANSNNVVSFSHPEMNLAGHSLTAGGSGAEESQQSQASLFNSGSELANSMELFSQPYSASSHSSISQHSQTHSTANMNTHTGRVPSHIHRLPYTPGYMVIGAQNSQDNGRGVQNVRPDPLSGKHPPQVLTKLICSYFPMSAQNSRAMYFYVEFRRTQQVLHALPLGSLSLLQTVQETRDMCSHLHSTSRRGETWRHGSQQGSL